MTTLEITLIILLIIVTYGIFSVHNDLDKALGRVSKLELLLDDSGVTIQNVCELLDEKLLEIPYSSKSEFENKVSELYDNYKKNLSDEEIAMNTGQVEYIFQLSERFNTLKEIEEVCKKLESNEESPYLFTDWKNHWERCWNKYPEELANKMSLNPPWQFKY